jgi:hypothetical protein
MGTLMLATGIACVVDTTLNFTMFNNQQMGLIQGAVSGVLMWIGYGMLGPNAARAYILGN